jgi:hypothetical protein
MWAKWRNSNEQLVEVNIFRRGKICRWRCHKKYNWHSLKGDLKERTLVLSLSMGQITLQLEDGLDILKKIYPQNDVLFLFDGHNKQKPNGLNA